MIAYYQKNIQAVRALQAARSLQEDITNEQDVIFAMHYFNSIHNPSPLSRHAKAQMQRRCIPEAAVELLLDFATATPSGGGTLRYRFDKRSWAVAEEFLGAQARAFEKFRNAYVIEASNGTVVTAAWLH
ncbi:hypothetical protein [Sphingorhabdus sp. 109]|jgi:hypothetical protein|uniref:hypothetical protein n=1 Tax=Sphingorhabdus sp. 109 TaxID=2653173 RepID=UPI0012F1C02D|nr:hypothetical protein [Sphingorhabdus sp. 109]VWX57297.1 conserved hypothetical protein [Sphingorhabdus sp. 109]